MAGRVRELGLEVRVVFTRDIRSPSCHGSIREMKKPLREGRPGGAFCESVFSMTGSLN